jgi:hypothetical protein
MYPAGIQKERERGVDKRKKEKKTRAKILSVLEGLFMRDSEKVV